MSSSDLAGFGELAAELRLARPAAPEALRAHLLALEPPEAHARPSLRRPALLLAPAALAAAAAAAVAIGVVQSGGRSEPVVLRGAARASDAQEAVPRPTALGAEGALPAVGGRAQRYEAELTLRVHDLSSRTKRALRLTRSLGGYVRTVDYGQGSEAGTALLVVRVPVRHVQQAVLRFSELGTILAQHVSIQDLQAGIDRRTREMARLRDRIAVLERQATPKALAQAELLRRRLVALQRDQAQALRQARFATVSLRLRTAEAQATPPPRPGRLERALHRAGAILVDELVVLLYVLVVGVPVALVAGAAFVAARLLRRRSLDRLLEQS